MERVAPAMEKAMLFNYLTMPEDVLDTYDEAVDPSFELESSMKSDVDHLQENFCAECHGFHTSSEKTVSLGLFLCFQCSKNFDLGD